MLQWQTTACYMRQTVIGCNKHASAACVEFCWLLVWGGQRICLHCCLWWSETTDTYLSSLVVCVHFTENVVRMHLILTRNQETSLKLRYKSRPFRLQQWCPVIDRFMLYSIITLLCNSLCFMKLVYFKRKKHKFQLNFTTYLLVTCHRSLFGTANSLRMLILLILIDFCISLSMFLNS